MEKRSSSPEDTLSERGRRNSGDRPRLTEEQKKANHIFSEQKRRTAIRAGFDKLCEVVPGLEGQGRSEGYVLTEVTKRIYNDIQDRKDLIARCQARGIAVPEYLLEAARIDLNKLDTSHMFPPPKSDGDQSSGGKPSQRRKSIGVKSRGGKAKGSQSNEDQFTEDQSRSHSAAYLEMNDDSWNGGQSSGE